MSIVLNGTTGITTPNVSTDTSTLGPLTQALNLGSTGQIVFPATQNASANANTLDDYEEGTWTPVFAVGGITGTSITYSGTYTKIGRMVTVNFIAYTASNNIDVAVYAGFSGLPFSTSTNFSGSVTTEDIDQFASLGFCSLSGVALYLSKCGNGTSNTVIATCTYFV